MCVRMTCTTHHWMSAVCAWGWHVLHIIECLQYVREDDMYYTSLNVCSMCVRMACTIHHWMSAVCAWGWHALHIIECLRYVREDDMYYQIESDDKSNSSDLVIRHQRVFNQFISKLDQTLRQKINEANLPD